MAMRLYLKILLLTMLGMLLVTARAALAWTPQPSTKPLRDGQAIYATYCAACHTRGMRGAPKPSDAQAWLPRLAQGTSALYDHSIKGMGWMPTRGGCSTCADAEIRAAVDHMLTLIATPSK